MPTPRCPRSGSARAGVSHVIGREANATYGETMNGIRPAGIVGTPQRSIDPWIRPGDPTSGLLPFIDRALWGEPGDSDNRSQSYCYRVTLTNDPANRVPFTKPANFNPLWHEALVRSLQLKPDTPLQKIVSLTPMPNRKTDTNPLDFVGANYNYPAATHAGVVAQHVGRAEPLDRRVCERLHARRIGDVRADADHAELVGGVVVPVDEIGHDDVGERGEAVRHARRDVHAEVVLAGDVEALGAAVGGAALAQVVQHDADGADGAVPVVGLVQVVVEADDAAGLPVAAVALDHLPPAREPRPAVGLDEAPALVGVDVGRDDDDAPAAGGGEDHHVGSLGQRLGGEGGRGLEGLLERIGRFTRASEQSLSAKHAILVGRLRPRARGQAFLKTKLITLPPDATVDDAIAAVITAARDHWVANEAAARQGHRH